MSQMNPAVSNVLTAVATAAILGIIGFFGGVFEKGAQAINEDQIETVIQRVLITDTGKTYAATLVEINGSLGVISSQIGELKDDVNDLEDAVLELASE